VKDHHHTVGFCCRAGFWHPFTVSKSVSISLAAYSAFHYSLLWFQNHFASKHFFLHKHILRHLNSAEISVLSRHLLGESPSPKRLVFPQRSTKIVTRYAFGIWISLRGCFMHRRVTAMRNCLCIIHCDCLLMSSENRVFIFYYPQLIISQYQERPSWVLKIVVTSTRIH